jgi:hypothetical protein
MNQALRRNRNMKNLFEFCPALNIYPDIWYTPFWTNMAASKFK